MAPRIISEQTHGGADLSDLGKDPLSNINGPSVIRVPEWVTDRLGKYYLYFAHHKGPSIRLAYADQMMGPWVVHPNPVLTVEQSLFVTKDLDPNSRSDWVNGPDYLYAHIASPDVHVDQNAKQILMFFHGLLPDGDQQTRLAHIRKWTILFGSAPSARAILPACISMAWALVFYASLG